MTQTLSDYFLRNASIDLNHRYLKYLFESTDYEWLPLHEKSDTFSYHVEEYHTTVSHSATSKPVLQPSIPKQSQIAFSQSSPNLIHHEHALHKIIHKAH